MMQATQTFVEGKKNQSGHALIRNHHEIEKKESNSYSFLFFALFHIFGPIFLFHPRIVFLRERAIKGLQILGLFAAVKNFEASAMMRCDTVKNLKDNGSSFLQPLLRISTNFRRPHLQLQLRRPSQCEVQRTRHCYAILERNNKFVGCNLSIIGCP